MPGVAGFPEAPASPLAAPPRLGRTQGLHLASGLTVVRDALPEPAAVSQKAQAAEAASSWRLPAGSLRRGRRGHVTRGRGLRAQHAFARRSHGHPRTHRSSSDLRALTVTATFATGCALTNACCGTTITAPWTLRLA
jgi:hypothetical protein